MRTWATRTAGALGMFLAVFYLALIVNQDGGLSIGSLVFFLIMAVAGLLAWFSERFPGRVGRLMVWTAFVLFLTLGFLALLTIGIVFMVAAVFCVIGVTGQSAREEEE